MCSSGKAKAGLLHRDLVSGEEPQFSRSGCSCASCPRLQCGLWRLRTPKLSSLFVPGTPVWGLCTRYPVSPRNSTKHRGADGGAVCPPLSFWAVGLAVFFHSPSCLLPCDVSSLHWVLVTSYTGSSTEIPFRFQVGTAPLLLAQGGPPLQVVLSVRSLQWNPLESVCFLIPAGTWTDTVTRCHSLNQNPSCVPPELVLLTSDSERGENTIRFNRTPFLLGI